MDGKEGTGDGKPKEATGDEKPKVAEKTSGNPKKSTKPPKMKSNCLKHKKVLKKKLYELCQSIGNVESLTIYMFSKCVISKSEDEQIHAQVTTEGKVRELMKVVLRKDEKAYDILLKALLETGNSHMRDALIKTEDELDSDEYDDEKRRRKKNKARKPGKIFTIYDAALSDNETSSDEELDDLPLFNTETENLFDLLVYVEWYLRLIKYHPQKLYNFPRFDTTADLVPVYPMKAFNKSFLRFRVTRAIFLKGIGLYGPIKPENASFLIEIKLVIQMSMDEDFTIGETKGIFEMKGNSRITYINFETNKPVRPHIWHFIEFSIKGQEEMAMQPEGNIETRREMPMIHDKTNHGKIIFEFDKLKSTGQIPELCFFRGKDVIGFEYFPKHNLSSVDDAQTLYTAKRFDSGHPTKFLAPFEEFNKSVQRFRVDRPIYLKSVGFFGPGNHETPEEAVASYKIKLKLMAWKDIDEPYILEEVDELVEVKCGKLMYVIFKKASKITPHTWHWIEFTIIGTTTVGAGKNGERKKYVAVNYGNDIDNGGVKFEFDTSVEHSTSQIPELCFYKANDASDFAGDKYLRDLAPDAQTLYPAYRFSDTHPKDLPVKPFLRFSKSCQRFKVNRVIYLKKVGFFGPATPDCIATYVVKMKLVLWSTKSPPFVIASTEKVVEGEHSKMMYVSFEKAQPIKPHIWHWIEFSIKGTEEMEVQNKMNKVKSYTVDYQFGGNVKFQFDNTPCYSTCQMPELWFFKGENEIDLSKFPKPTIETNEKTERKCCACIIS